MVSFTNTLTLVPPSFFCNMVYQGGGYHPLMTWNWRAQSMIVWYHGIGHENWSTYDVTMTFSKWPDSKSGFSVKIDQNWKKKSIFSLKKFQISKFHPVFLLIKKVNGVSKGVFINTLVGGLGKMEGGQKSFELPKGGETKKFSVVKGGVKKFGQIESIMNIKMHNLLLKLAGYSLKLDLYFKIFPGPSAGPALHLALKMPPLAQPLEHLAFV